MVALRLSAYLRGIETCPWLLLPVQIIVTLSAYLRGIETAGDIDYGKACEGVISVPKRN